MDEDPGVVFDTAQLDRVKPWVVQSANPNHWRSQDAKAFALVQSLWTHVGSVVPATGEPPIPVCCIVQALNLWLLAGAKNPTFRGVSIRKGCLADRLDEGSPGTHCFGLQRTHADLLTNAEQRSQLLRQLRESHDWVEVRYSKDMLLEVLELLLDANAVEPERVSQAEGACGR